MSVTFYIATARSTPLLMSYDDGEPSENYANVNAANLLRAVGLTSEPSGDIPAEDVPTVLRAAVRALNTAAGCAELERPGYIDGRVIQCATADDYAQRALTRFVALLKRASELKRIVYWG